MKKIRTGRIWAHFVDIWKVLGGFGVHFRTLWTSILGSASNVFVTSVLLKSWTVPAGLAPRVEERAPVWSGTMPCCGLGLGGRFLSAAIGMWVRRLLRLGLDGESSRQ